MVRKVKKKQKLTVLAGIVLAAALMTACAGSGSQNAEEVTAEVETKTEFTVPDAKTEEAEASNVIRPLYPLTSAEDALADGGYSVYFTAEDLVQNGDGYELTVEVYEYDRYEENAIARMQVGDRIQVCRENVTIESIEENEETGYILLNGGTENGGVELRREDGLYRTCTMDDYPMYYSVGTVTIPLSTEATLEDHSDIEKEPDGVVYEYADIPDAVLNSDMYFSAGNTVVTVRGEQIVQIIRYWVP